MLAALVVGAICMILVERRRRKPTCVSLDELTPSLALGIGCFQCLALWPGFSRSAATIMGGMLLGARRALAAEYSFIAAVPIMMAATGYDLLKNFFAVGMIGAFVSALLAVKAFVALVGKMTLVPFAVYRLALAPFVYYFMVR